MQHFWRLCANPKVVIALFIVLISINGSALEAPIITRVLTFPDGSFFHAVETIIHQNPNTRRQRTVKFDSHMLGGECASFASNFQRRALEVYLNDGYISQQLHDDLLTSFEKVNRAQQVVLLQQFSTVNRQAYFRAAQETGVSYKEAESRVLKVRAASNRRPEQDIDTVDVSRGTIFIIKGFEHVANGAGSKIIPLDIPWMRGDLPTGLARRLDRSKVRDIVEVGRTHIEKKFLKGQLELAANTILSVLEGQLQAYGIDPKRVVVTANFKDAFHLRLFTSSYPLRILNKQVQQALEDNLDLALSNYLELPLPQTREEWVQYKDSVVFGSFAQAIPQRGLISEFAHRVSTHLGWNILAEKALGFYTDLITALRQDFDVVNPQTQRASEVPIVIEDFNTPMYSAKIRRILRQNGIAIESPAGQSFMDYFASSKLERSFPDTATAHWTERRLIVPISLAEVRQQTQNSTVQMTSPQKSDPPQKRKNKLSLDDLGDAEPMLMVLNIDKKAAHENRIAYLASILLAVSDYYTHTIANYSPEEMQDLVWALSNHDRKPPVKLQSLQFSDFNLLFPIAVASSDPDVQAQLRAMGGEEFVGISIRTDHMHSMEQKLQNSLGTFQVDLVEVQQQMDRAVNAGLAPAQLQSLFQQLAQRAVQSQLNQFLNMVDPLKLLDIQPAPIFLFRTRQIDEIERTYPELTANARQRLWPAHYRERLRALFSAQF